MIWAATVVWLSVALVPVLAVRLAGERAGFSTPRMPDLIQICLESLAAGEATVLLTLGSLLLPLFAVAVPLALGCVHLARRSLSLHRMTVHRRARLPEWVRALAARAGLAREPVYLDDARAYAFAFGWWRPRAALSRGMVDMLSTDELLAVLRHEAHHTRPGGMIRHAVLDLLGCSFPHWRHGRELAAAARLAEELAADRAACRNGSDASALLSALLKLARLGTPPLPYALPGMSGWLEARVRAVCEGRPAPVAPGLRWLRGPALAAAIVAAPLAAHAADWHGLELRFDRAPPHASATTC
jgi:Zn-dependent protease with chaperone function